MSWADGPLMAWDTETTSADPNTARIVTACTAAIFGNAVETREWLIDPGIEIPQEASAIHGVTTEHARTHGELPAVAVAAIFEHLTAWWARGYPVIIMNASFDCTILDRELRRHCNSGLGKPGPILDPRVIDKHLDDLVGYHRQGGRKLIDLAEHYKVRLDDAHTAQGDCLAAARVVWRMARIYPEEIAGRSLDELQRLQSSWHAQQCASLQQYFDRKGQAEQVDPSWPLREVA